MATAWPGAADLISWIGASASDELTAVAAGVMEDVIDDVLSRIPVAALPSSQRPGGTNVDCPLRLRRALLIFGQHAYSDRAPADVDGSTSASMKRAERVLATLTEWPEA